MSLKESDCPGQLRKADQHRRETQATQPGKWIITWRLQHRHQIQVTQTQPIKVLRSMQLAVRSMAQRSYRVRRRKSGTDRVCLISTSRTSLFNSMELKLLLMKSQVARRALKRLLVEESLQVLQMLSLAMRNHSNCCLPPRSILTVTH